MTPTGVRSRCVSLGDMGHLTGFQRWAPIFIDSYVIPDSISSRWGLGLWNMAL